MCKSQREFTTKELFKTRAKAFIESISRKCFGRSYLGSDSVKNSRRQELTFKLKIRGKNAHDSLKDFNDELIYRVKADYRLSFTGEINPKTCIYFI